MTSLSYCMLFKHFSNDNQQNNNRIPWKRQCLVTSFYCDVVFHRKINTEFSRVWKITA